MLEDLFSPHPCLQGVNSVGRNRNSNSPTIRICSFSTTKAFTVNIRCSRGNSIKTRVAVTTAPDGRDSTAAACRAGRVRPAGDSPRPRYPPPPTPPARTPEWNPVPPARLTVTSVGLAPGQVHVSNTTASLLLCATNQARTVHTIWLLSATNCNEIVTKIVTDHVVSRAAGNDAHGTMPRRYRLSGR